MKTNRAKSFLALVLIIGCIAFSHIKSSAFTLIGPFQSWMQMSNGVIKYGDIGGPMYLTNEYRWNVPVVTYGFDPSFIKFFGTNGMSAVQAAIQILNSLPPVSQMNLSNYPLDPSRLNQTAYANSLVDFKSQVLSSLLEQLGLSQPARHVWQINKRDAVLESAFAIEASLPNWVFTNDIQQFNYDPISLQPTSLINGNLYDFVIYNYQNVYPQNPNLLFIYNYPVNSAVRETTTAADFAGGEPQMGVYLSGLTRDDVGGLAYLLSTNNVNYENLIPGTTGANSNSSSFVNGAWRPGVDKITFSPHPFDPNTGFFLPTTNYYTDTFISNGVPQQQALARVIQQPDFMFTADDYHYRFQPFQMLDRTGTSNWINNASANGVTNGAGPGAIVPPVRITFNRLAKIWYSSASSGSEQVTSYPTVWASFGGTTNPPVTYPVLQTSPASTAVEILFVSGYDGYSYIFTPYSWNISAAAYSLFQVQTSSNLTDWIPLFTATNAGGKIQLNIFRPSDPSRFYRLAPQ